MTVSIRLVLIVWLFFSFCASSLSLADSKNSEVEFTVTPNKCVSLHQGQTCFQALNFSWSTPQQGEFCLHTSSLIEPLICWNSNEKTSFKYDFQSAQGVKFQIIEKTTSSSIADVEVRIAWVYKSKKRKTGSWRLF